MNFDTPINGCQMVDGTMTFTVDNGRGPITAIFKPDDRFNFCDGKWHEIHAVKVRIINSHISKKYMRRKVPSKNIFIIHPFLS